jgi:hypothetical protein
MDLQGIANSAIVAVNPNCIATILTSNGYDVGTKTNGFKQQPKYNTPVANVPVQVQPLSTGDLQHTEAMNLSGVSHTLYISGRLASVIRPDSKGGDLVTITTGNGAVRAGDKFLVVGVLESWDNWTKAAVQYQGQ